VIFKAVSVPIVRNTKSYRVFRRNEKAGVLAPAFFGKATEENGG
jgi:hypothetical protein